MAPTLRDITRPHLPFVLDGTAVFTVKTGAAAPDEPLPAVAGVVLDVDTHASASRPVLLGAPGSWSVALKTNAGVQVTAIRRSDAALVREYALESYFATHPDDLVLMLSVGMRADRSFAGTFRYAALTVGAPLEAGRDVGLLYARGCAADAPLATLLPDFFSHVRLPAMVTTAPGPGEIIRIDYGGYLRFGASVGLKWALKGTPSLDLGRLQLSEHYQTGLAGMIACNAEAGGFFSVEVRAAVDEEGQSMPAWARVIVRRTRTSELTFAADASVTVKTAPRKVRGTPPEFLGALLGVNVGSWLNLLRHVSRLTDWNQLTSELDDLAFDFLHTWFGRTVTTRDLRPLLAKVKAVVDEAGRVDATVMSVVAQEFEAITGADPGGQDVAQGLQTLADLPSWRELQGEVPPTVWRLADMLTDGDPLAWMAGRPVGELRQRAATVLAVARAAATSELGAVIRLARAQYRIESLLAQLRAVDTPRKLEAALKTRAGALLARLLGPEIRAVSATQLGGVVSRLHAVLAGIDRFEQQVYDAFTGALTQSLSLKLHAEYSRASSEEALIDLSIKTSAAEGRALLQAAVLGDCAAALGGRRPDLVRLNRGRLTHDLVRTSTLDINVIGWHDGWRYQSVEQVILHTEQQMVPEEGGGLTVFSTIDLTKKTEEARRRVRSAARDLVHTNFLLRLLGESHGIIAAEPVDRQYLVDAITRMSAGYQLSFDDSRTTANDLAYYLGFAREFGLVDPALAPAALEALLPLQGADDYGRIVAQYDVRYTDEGLRMLFAQPPDEPTVRRLMRKVVLAGYLAKGRGIADEGWAYWTPAVRDLWKAAPGSFVRLGPVVHAVAPSPFSSRRAPASVTLPVGRQAALGALYGIEDDFVAGFQALSALIQAGRTISPAAFERALGRIGAALQALDRFAESVNATFALFDALVMHAGGRRASSLTLKSWVAGRRVTKVFVAPERPSAPSA